MIRTFRAASVVLAVFSGSLPLGAAEVQFPLASRLGIVPPPGLELSGTFQGFEDRENNVYIRLVALPEKAFSELEKTMTNDALKKQGITVEKREAFPLKTGKGLLIVARQEVKPDRIRKWLLVAPIDKLTALVSVETTDKTTKKYPDAAIRTALATLVARSTVPVPEQLQLVPFQISDLAGLRLVRVVPGTAVQLTDGPGDQFEIDQPHLVISVAAGGPQQPGDRDAFARLALGDLPPVKEVRISGSESMRINGQPGHEVRAEAKDAKTGTEIEIVQWLRFGSGAYMRMIGFAPKGSWTAAFMRFRQVRDSLEPR